MKWHVDDIPFLLTHLPHAVYDLMHHENVVMVQNTLANVKPDHVAPRHHIHADAPRISIEKTLDPIAQRSAQNIGLLLHDYMSQLPSFDVSDPEAMRLLEHWRKVMLEQPQRIATAHLSHGHDEKTKAFWRDKLLTQSKALGISPEVMMEAWDDWQRTSGAGHPIAHPLQQQAMQERQWQDLVMRARLHHETVMRNSGQSPSHTLHY